jgi:HPt (histidine-containing phosphotransfer) domain-containing protein
MKSLFTRNRPVSGPALLNMYDLSLLEEMDDNEYVLEVLTILLEETPGDLKQMKTALLASRAEQVYQAAHKLKSSAGIIQATALTALLTDIESMAKTGMINNDLAALVEDAGAQYQEIAKALKVHMASLG